MFYSLNDFFWFRNDSSQASEMFYGDFSIDCQTHVLYHLSGIDLGYKYAFTALCKFMKLLLRERP